MNVLPLQTIILWLSLICSFLNYVSGLTQKEVINLREEVRRMFYHAYDGYMEYAYPYDELRPLTCDGHDTWGSYSLTLIDALDTLAVMGNKTEFQRVANLIAQKTFDVDINVSVFETNIRILGGLLSAHLMSHKMDMELEKGWPCDGPLLRMAKDVATRLLPAFDTPTGMPYGTVNLREGVPLGETPVTCTAGIGTYIVEFGTLSRLTGDPVYEEVALRALHAVWNHRSSINLLGNHIDVISGRWTAQDSGIGAGIDSYFEYLVKGASLLQRPELMAIFKEARTAIDKYLRHDDWYLWASMNKGHVTMAVFQSLEAYWPGVLALLGDIDNALKNIFNYHQVWKQFGFTPEFYNIPQAETSANREGYPLRPELVESLMYLYRATKDDTLLKMGADIVSSIQHAAKTSCGYATVKNVNVHTLDNRMESFFLAETTKYLYLLFDTENWIHNAGETGYIHEMEDRTCILDAGGYIFNSEAHPVDPGALACCHTKEEDWTLSIDDQVALIVDPTISWRKHKGHSSKKVKEKSGDCQETSEKLEPPKVETATISETITLDSATLSEVITMDNEEVNKESEDIITAPKSSLKDKDKIMEMFENMAKDGAITDDMKEMYNLMKNIESRNAQIGKQSLDDVPSEDFDNVLLDNFTQSEEEELSDSLISESSGSDINLPKDEEMLDDTIDAPKIIKQDDGPRFSSLSEPSDKAFGGNDSEMEASSISPSVSSSKYTINVGTPRIVSEPRDHTTSKPFKKVFILKDLKERLITDLSSYKNFTLSSSYSLLSCSHPPFTNILNFKGQMFNP